MIGLAFTPEQFKALMRMIYVANTVINGHRDKDYLKEYDDLEQYIFSRAKAAGFPAATWSHKAGSEDSMGSPQEEHHHPSRIFENDPELTGLMDEYDHTMLGELLAEMLAERDIEQKHGSTAKTQMPAKEYDALFALYAEAYAEEFHKSGFGRLVIAKEQEGQPVKVEEEKRVA